MSSSRASNWPRRTRWPDRTMSSRIVAGSADWISCALLDGMTLPCPGVTSSTWASIAHSKNKAKPIAAETMISRDPVSGWR